MTFREELALQRRDDHRYYHHSRVNQTLHLLSAVSFLAAYAFMFVDPVRAALLGWLVAMVLRQCGHFFFEPKTYDTINDVSHQHKESIKVGYNLERKIVLHALWLLIPVTLYWQPSLFGLIEPYAGMSGFVHDVALGWLYLGVAALAWRTVQLFHLMGVQPGLVWTTKVLTDPFHDIRLYHGAPIALLKHLAPQPASSR